MSVRQEYRAIASLLILVAAAAQPLSVAIAAGDDPKPPAELFQELFMRVQDEAVFADSKTFADAVPKQPPDLILNAYRTRKYPDHASLVAFVSRYFELPAASAPAPAAAMPSLKDHIRAQWPQLIRDPAPPPPWSSELDFGARYVVPGGRFRELYYWDSYFTLLGLVRDGHGDIARDMVDGFARLIERYGHVPNGTRSYYLSRSQPPFFYLMAGLLDPQDPGAADANYLPALRREYTFWMDGEQGLARGTAAGHAVRLADGSVLNRYWDRRDTPRDESYRLDVGLARTARRPAAGLYRDLRSAAESGWDFSSRWLADGRHLATIETTAIVPVDLNSLLYGLELAIAQACTRKGERDCATEFTARAGRRQRAMNRYPWNDARGQYEDYNWRSRRRTGKLSAATLYPLFTGEADRSQADAVSKVVRRRLLARGGLATTTRNTGQQWDRPNGWAPLQWLAISGLKAYGQARLAGEIAHRWLRTVECSYAAEGRLVEKYNVQTLSRGGGGEYPLQDGFGWTNGVTRALLDLYPEPDEQPSGGH